MSEALQILQNIGNTTLFDRCKMKSLIPFLSGQDNFALMPTGGGKSVFQIPAMMNEGICLVISPLVAFNERPGCQFAKAQYQSNRLNRRNKI
jgi:ATP-dependent DNA helicase RecQ